MAASTPVEADAPAVTLGDTPSKKRKSKVDEIEVDLSLPEPPSKKAKRLLKKGKPLPVKPASDDEAEENEKAAALKPDAKGGKEKNKRSEHGIWIGNLPFDLTRTDLFKWLVDNSGGTIKEENITRVNLPTLKQPASKGPRREGDEGDRNKPQNRGFAYVDFDAETAAVAAMALTETELGGRKVLIKNSTSFEGRPKKQAPVPEKDYGTGANGMPVTATAAAKKDVIPSRKIYVGNLSFQATEDDLRAQFERCGEIEWVKVATFEDSGKCKGYGWVKFKEPEAAGWAVKGFVKIKEEIETEDDFRDDKDGEEDGEADEAETKKTERGSEKKYKMRKWFVNRLHGRELKIAHAEDDQTRYKKRFGKDAPERKAKGASSRGAPAADKKGDEGGASSRPAPSEKKKTYGDAGVASYLTGSVVKPEGKKITFD